MEIKFGNYRSHSYQQLLEEQKAGGRFVVYQWIIPLPLFTPIKRLSRVYFIDSSSRKTKYSRKYNVLNLILGWWGLPLGPIYLFQSINLNMKGGVDVTEDIMLNINEKNYLKGSLVIKEKARKFIHPPKSERKEFSKVFKKLIIKNIITKPPVVGYYIDTQKNEKPYYVVGISNTITKELETAISKEVYQRFYKHMKYKLVDLNTDFENKQALIKQGLNIDYANKTK